MSETFGWKSNGSVRSTLNWTKICRSTFTNRFIALLLFSRFHLCREFWKEIKLVRAIPLGSPSFVGNCRCSFSTPGSPDQSVWLTAPFNNMRTLTFKAQPTNAFFATVSQVFGDSSQPPTTVERAVIKSLSTVQITKQCSAVVGS